KHRSISMSNASNQRPSTPGTASIDLYVGGGMQAIPQAGDPTNADAVWVFDTYGELRNFIAKRDGDERLFAVELGEGETSHSLASQAPPGIRKALRNVATMDAQDGCGQGRGFGALGMRKKRRTDSFNRAFETLCDQLLVRPNGDIRHIEL